jgi:hypothetical protein
MVLHNAKQTSWVLPITYVFWGQDSVVGLATRHGLDGPGIESRWRARSAAPVQTGPGADPASSTMGTVSFPGVKWPRRGFDHPLLSSAEVKERVQLYLYSPSGPSLPVLRWTLPLLAYFGRNMFCFNMKYGPRRRLEGGIYTPPCRINTRR